MKHLLITKKIIIFILFYSILFSSLIYFYSIITRIENSAKLVYIKLPKESNSITYAFDDAKMEKWKNGKSFIFKGWCFNENVKSENRKVFIIFKSRKKTYIFKIDKDNILRPDVSKNFHIKKNINNHGFETAIPIYKMEEDNYKIGLLIINDSNTFFSFTNKELKLLNNNTLFVDPGWESKFISQQITIKYKESTKKLLYFFDKIIITENYLTIIGWSFIEGSDDNLQKSYVLLKSKKELLAFETELQIRADITSGFNKNGVNLDSTGFTARIPLINIEKGNYNLGLYITTNEQTGFVISENKINIDKNDF